MPSLQTWTQFAEKAEPLNSTTDDLRLLNNFVGLGNWGTELESFFLTKDNLVVAKIKLWVSLKEDKKKKKEETNTSEEEEKEKKLAVSGVGIVNLEDSFQETVIKVVRRARHMALSQLGFSLEIEENDTLPTPNYPAYQKQSSSASPTKKPLKKASGDPESEECAVCEEQVKGYKTKQGKWLNASQVRKMTYDKYGEVLCMDCNVARFKEERSK